MLNTAFQTCKLRRALKIQGKEYLFKRYGANKFKEKTPVELDSISIKGIFHNTTSYTDIAEGASTKKQRKFTPMLMVLHEDYIVKPVLTGDVTEFMGQRYKVTGVENVEESDYAINISLEVVAIA